MGWRLGLSRVASERGIVLFLCHPPANSLVSQGARLREKSEKESGGDDDDESSDESEIEEELGYFSPLDHVDPYVSFKQALTSTCDFLLLWIIAECPHIAFQMQNPASYQVSTTSLNVEQQTLLMEVMRIAETQTGGEGAH